MDILDKLYVGEYFSWRSSNHQQIYRVDAVYSDSDYYDITLVIANHRYAKPHIGKTWKKYRLYLEELVVEDEFFHWIAEVRNESKEQAAAKKGR